jgi:hypothetical protein
MLKRATFPIVTVCVALVASIKQSHAAPPLPTAAQVIIREVSAAASRKDFVALEALMAREFTWSFGGDVDAKQALAEWQSQPRYLQELRRVTRLPCQQQGEYVECPANANAGYRAGFKRTQAGWRMVYFVAGD